MATLSVNFGIPKGTVYKNSVSIDGLKLTGATISQIQVTLSMSGTTTQRTVTVNVYKGTSASGTLIGKCSILTKQGASANLSGGTLSAIIGAPKIYVTFGAAVSTTINSSCKISTTYTPPTASWSTSPALSFVQSGESLIVQKTAGTATANGNHPFTYYLYNYDTDVSIGTFGSDNKFTYTPNVNDDTTFHFYVIAMSSYNPAVKTEKSNGGYFQYTFPGPSITWTTAPQLLVSQTAGSSTMTVTMTAGQATHNYGYAVSYRLYNALGDGTTYTFTNGVATYQINNYGMPPEEGIHFVIRAMSVGSDGTTEDYWGLYDTPFPYDPGTLTWSGSPSLAYAVNNLTITFTKTGTATHSWGGNITYYLYTYFGDTAWEIAGFTGDTAQLTSSSSSAEMYNRFFFRAKHEASGLYIDSPIIGFVLKPSDMLKIYNNGNWKNHLVYYYNGERYVYCCAKYYNGTEWVSCGNGE